MINRIRSTAFFRGGQNRTKPVRHFLRKFFNDWSLDLAAMLAYNLLIALLPIAVALFGILGIILRNNPGAEERIKETIINSTSFDNTTQQGIKQVSIRTQLHSILINMIFVSKGLRSCFQSITCRCWFHLNSRYNLCNIWWFKIIHCH